MRVLRITVPKLGQSLSKMSGIFGTGMDAERQDLPSKCEEVWRQTVLFPHEREVFFHFQGIEFGDMHLKPVFGEHRLRGLADYGGEKDISVGDDGPDKHGNPP